MQGGISPLFTRTNCPEEKDLQYPNITQFLRSRLSYFYDVGFPIYILDVTVTPNMLNVFCSGIRESSHVKRNREKFQKEKHSL